MLIRHLRARLLFRRHLDPKCHLDKKWESQIRTNKRQRAERLQVMLSKDELAEIDEFRFEKRMPTRAAAVREIMRRALVVFEKEERPGPD